MLLDTSLVGRTSTSALDLRSGYRKPAWTPAAVLEDRPTLEDGSVA